MHYHHLIFFSHFFIFIISLIVHVSHTFNTKTKQERKKNTSPHRNHHSSPSMAPSPTLVFPTGKIYHPHSHLPPPKSNSLNQLKFTNLFNSIKLSDSTTYPQLNLKKTLFVPSISLHHIQFWGELCLHHHQFSSLQFMHTLIESLFDLFVHTLNNSLFGLFDSISEFNWVFLNF